MSENSQNASRVVTADWSTDDIVRAIRKGDVEAYRYIVIRYQGEVMKVVNAMLIDNNAREDVVQLVFVRAFQKLDQYELGRGFSFWVKAIARNLVREELRKRYRYNARIEKYTNLVIDRLDSEAETTASEEEEKLRANALHECIDELEETAARAVRLKYFESKNTADIAVSLERSPGSIRTLLYRVRTSLRDCLESKGVLAS